MQCCIATLTIDNNSSTGMMWVIKSDTVAVLPRYPRYYRWNGIEIHGSTAVMGLELTVFPR